MINHSIPDVPTKLHYVDTQEDAHRMIDTLLKQDVVGFDTETYNSFDRNVPAFEPCTGARMRLAQFAIPSGETWAVDLYKVDRSFIKHLFPNPFLLVGQNLKFELKFLMFELGIYEYGNLWDTLLAEQIISKGRVAGNDRVWVSLDAIAKRRLGVDLPKDEQNSLWYREQLSESQVQYAARDAIVVLPIWQEQKLHISSQDQLHVTEIEFGALPAFAWMENNGIKLNPDKWNRLLDEIDNDIETLKQKLWSAMGPQGTLFEGVPTVNLNSRPQVKKAFQAIGINIPLDKDGKESVRKDNISGIDREEVKMYLEYVKLSKRVTSYGRNWVDKRNVFNGKIHCNINQIGAETGRSSAREPNLMQIPKEDSYRNCFEAEDGWLLVDADLSQAELRVLAEYCRDEAFLKAFDEGHDLHKYTAHLLFKTPLADVTKQQRGLAKNLNFGIVYGIGAAKFAVQSGIDLARAEEIMSYYLRDAYPKLGLHLETAARMIMKTGTSKTMAGRLRTYVGDWKDRQFQSEVQRNAKNMPIQGTVSDMVKRALALLYQEIVREKNVNNMRILLPVHDEIIMDARGPYAREAEHLLVNTMALAESEFLVRVPAVVDSEITRIWCKEPSEDQLNEAREIMGEKRT